MISINFNLGRDDIIAFNKVFQNNSGTVKASILRARCIFPILMLGLAIYYYWRYDAYIFLLPLVLGGLWFALYPVWMRRYMLKMTEKLLKEASHAKSLGAYSVTFDDEGISSKSPIGESKFTWSAVDRVLLTNEHLHVFLIGSMGYPIPRREVGDDLIEKVKSFVELKIQK